MSRSTARALSKTSSPTRLEKSPSQTKDVRRAIVSFKSVEDYISEIETLWNEAAESFLLVGRWLNSAKETLAHGEYQRMVEERLPFDKSRAYQLRMVATMIDSGRVAELDLPRSSSTAFLFVSLDQKALAKAKHDGVLRPNVRRQEVQEWKRILIVEHPKSQAIDRTRATLRARIRRYEMYIARAREQLAKLEPHFPDGPTIDGEGEVFEAVE